MKMSEVGRLTRGMKWYGMRDLEGNLPEGVANDRAKMNDVEHYLAFIDKMTEPNKKKTERSLSKLRWLARKGMKQSKEYKEAAEGIGLEEHKVNASDGSTLVTFKKKEAVSKGGK